MTYEEIIESWKIYYRNWWLADAADYQELTNDAKSS